MGQDVITPYPINIDNVTCGVVDLFTFLGLTIPKYLSINLLN